ncbi:MAG: MoxR family ATPase [Candidatus Marinimicrobia bacterium]|nr:MoxR family ATPase [Candidatus Neomarinimicrobiota bacterium]
MSDGIGALNERVQAAGAFLPDLRREIERVIVGQHYMVERLLLGLLSNGHVLLEGVPGLAKTLCVRTLASALAAQFQRIQFTPDLLPADLIGTQIYNPREGVFTTRRGPVFTQILLADEVNRAPPKVQSALLEAMQERQVTIGGESLRLPEPFMVLATQNPIEQEGTYPLPEAQLDRFMLKLRVGYPDRTEERRILDEMAVTDKIFAVKPVVSAEAILAARQVVNEVYLDDKIKEYILSLVFATREPETFKLDLKPYLRYGASPRATINLALAARTQAFLQGRGYVTPQDVKTIAPDILRHRILISYEAEAEELTSDDLIARLLQELPVP